MALHHYLKKYIRIKQIDIFKLCLSISILFHSIACGAYLISTLPAFNEDTIYDAKNFKAAHTDVDFFDIPPAEIFGGSSNPAPVEKKEWIEGAGKNAPDADNSDLNINRISGTGTDPDGYLSSDMGDHPPIPIIDFDLNRFFPSEAKSANIRRKTIILHMQIDEDGSIKSAKISSPPSGYGFDEAVMKIIHKIRFKPGRVDGKSVKMFMRLPITFVLED
jgi:protein TonB